MFNLDPSKLLIIGVVAIILLGPDRLPQVARQVGGVWRTINEYRHRMESEVRRSMPDLPSSAEIARLARSPSALLNHLSAMSPDPDEAVPTPPSPAPPESGVATVAVPPAVQPATRSMARPLVTQASSPLPDSGVPGDPGLN
jgi:sec-independent protein translocase protein TatB